MCKLLNKGFHSNQYHKMSSNKIRNKSCQTREKLELLRELDNVGVRDFLVLGNCDLIVTSQVLVGNLVKRFCSDICYTSIGRNLLLFVNPNKPLAIYSTVVKEIYAKLFHGNEELTTPPPHIYSTINCAIHDGLSSLCKSQTLLFSGESGSGKSTNYFHALDYLRFLGNHNEKIEQIFNHNLVLNYFGGAMETDSTRFVKLINLEFDFRGEVQGAGFECYHLEKWRLCGNYNTSNEAINCQNFHIFYILVGGCEGGVLKSLNLLRNPDNYKLLKLVNKNYGNLYPYSNGLLSNQEQAFQFLKKTLPLTPLEFTSLLQILSSILHLGNTTITMTTNLDGSEATTINYGPQNSSEIISNLLQVTQNIIPNITSLPNPSRILIALMQNIYTRLFSWLSRKLGIVSKGDKSFSLKLLDFTGFTDFHGNTNFENFIVNYVNEKVQMCLVDVRLRLHQEEWVRDGLEWIWIDTSGGGAVGEWLDWVEGPLIENSGGWGHKGDGDDGELSFIRLPPRHHGNNTPTTSPHKSQHPKKITNFYTHNPPDTLPPSLLQILSTSTNPLLSSLYSSPNPTPSTTPSPKLLPNLPQVKLQLNHLLTQLTRTHLKYVRCIKPSTNLTIIEPSFVKYQLNYHRILDYYKVYKFCHVKRFNFNQFLRRYKLLSLKTWPNCAGCHDDKFNVCTLMGDLCFVGGRDFVVGRGGIFLKREEILISLETYRTERLDDLALLIQKTFRCYRIRKKFVAMTTAQILIAKFWRKYLKSRKVRKIRELKLMRKSVNAIQRCYIQWKRLLYLRQLTTEVTRLTSPVSKSWPHVPSYLQETNSLLKILFHRWRCRQYRRCLDNHPSDRLRLNEKSTASEIFKGEKESYERSITHPFLGDYIRLRQNSQWRRMDSSPIVFADLINKVARSSGKLIPTVLVTTTTAILLLDPRTLSIKYKIHPNSLKQITMSTLNDDFCVFQIDHSDEEVAMETMPRNSCICSNNLNSGDKVDYDGNNTGGDLIFHTCHLIEMVTKIVLVCGNFCRNFGNHSLNNCHGEKLGAEMLRVVFSNEFLATFHSTPTTIKFIPQTIKTLELIPPIK